jgi:hypothetical protein
MTVRTKKTDGKFFIGGFLVISEKVVNLQTEIKKEFIMPTISMFYGLIVRMFYAPEEHNPPHIHAIYQSQEALVAIKDGQVLKGTLSNRHLKFIQAWIEIHKEELLANWDLCQHGEPPFKINPLN